MITNIKLVDNMITNIKIEVFGDFYSAFDDAKKLATEYNCSVEYKFNGFEISVDKESNMSTIWEHYTKDREKLI